MYKIRLQRDFFKLATNGQGVFCPKMRLQRDFFKLATNEQSDKAFLLTSKFCPQGVVCTSPGAIYMY